MMDDDDLYGYMPIGDGSGCVSGIIVGILLGLGLPILIAWWKFPSLVHYFFPPWIH